MTGAQLAAELQEIRPDIPVILCTGFSETINEEKIEIMGISAYIRLKLFLKTNIINDRFQL